LQFLDISIISTLSITKEKIMVTALFMGWTDPVSKKWFPIKKMTWDNGKYYTVYLQGMLAAMEVSESHRTAVKHGLMKINRVRISNDIEVSFRVRMPVHRPFDDLAKLERLGLSTDLARFDPFEYVARSGGYTGSDSYDLFPEVTPDEFGKYHFYFGIRDIEGLEIDEYISQLEIGTQLTTKDNLIYHNGEVLGRTPGYLSDLANFHPQAFKLTVAKIIHHVYRFGKLLCHVEIDSKVIIPFSDLQYQPLVNILTAAS
jgi:hypothetical protein